MKRLYSTVFAVCLFFTFFSSDLFSQIYVKHNATGSNDGTSWANAYTDLTTALGNTSSNEYWIAGGTYHPGSGSPVASSTFLINRDVALYGGFAGTETSLGHRNPAVNETKLSGDIAGDDIQNNFTGFKSDNVMHVFVVASALTGPIVFDGLSIIGGHTLNTAGVAVSMRSGGGIYAESPVKISNCKFYNNFGRSGGSVYLAQTASGSVVEDCTFNNNSASEDSAGLFALRNAPLTVTGCTFTDNRTNRGALYPRLCEDVLIDNCSFTGNINSVTDGNAGALYVWNNLNFTLSNSEFTANRATTGGAVYFNGSELSPDPTNFNITDCQFLNNEATGNGGGVIAIAASATIEDCIFDGNTAGGAGHLYQSVAGNEMIVRNCEFKNAECSGWGGAATCYGAGAQCLFEDCDFTQNTTTNLGGAVNNGFQAIATYLNCSFSENRSTASAGGALAMQNDFTQIIVLNSDFTNNSTVASPGGALYSGAQTSSGIMVVDGCNFLLNTSGSSVGGAIHINESGAKISELTLSNSTFFFNTATNQAGALNLGNTDATITSCVFGFNEATGTGTGGAISINASSSDNTQVSLMNSVFADNTGTLSAGIAAWTDTTGTANTTMQNCIFRQGGSLNYAIEDGTPTVISNGGNMSDDGTLVDYLTEASDIHGEDPDFVDAGNFDYSINDGSLAIDAGIDAGAPEFDIEGNPRINKVDIGAYENQNVTNVKETLLENNGMLTIAPNPVRASHAKATLANQWSGDLQVRLFNVLGQPVLTMDLAKTSETVEFQLDLQGVKTGVYELVVSNGKQAVVTRLIRIQI